VERRQNVAPGSAWRRIGAIFLAGPDFRPREWDRQTSIVPISRRAQITPLS
jgi:hypothetical protein